MEHPKREVTQKYLSFIDEEFELAKQNLYSFLCMFLRIWGSHRSSVVLFPFQEFLEHGSIV